VYHCHYYTDAHPQQQAHSPPVDPLSPATQTNVCIKLTAAQCVTYSVNQNQFLIFWWPGGWITQMHSHSYWKLLTKANKTRNVGQCPNVMATLPNIGGALCSTPHFG